MGTPDVVVHEFENGRQWIRATINTFRAKTFLDLRVWYEATPGSPLKPTPKGVAILAENLDELEASVEAFKKALGPAARKKAA